MRRIREHLLQLRQTLTVSHWIELAEYAALAGAAVGTIAAAASQQVVYAAAPLTLAFGFNVANRHQLYRKHRLQTANAIAMVDQLMGDIESVRYSVQTLERPGGVDQIEFQKELAKVYQSINLLDNKAACLNVKVYQNLKTELDTLSQEITSVSEPFDINEIKAKIASLHTDLHSLAKRPVIDRARFDELYQLFVNMEQRNREVVLPYIKNLVQDFKKLQQTDANLTAKLNELTQKFNARTELSQLSKLQRVVAGLTESVTQLQQTEVIAKLFAEVENISHELTVLTQQFHNRPELQLIEELRQGFAQLPSPDVLLEQVQGGLEVRIYEFVRSMVGEINSFLSVPNSHDYQLLFDGNGCRAVLLEALSQASERLIIVSPWLKKDVFNELRQHFEEALNRGVQIQVGWGDESEFGLQGDTQTPISLNKSRLSYHKERDKYGKYSALPDLVDLQNNGSGFSLHLLGSQEQFLVCDRSFALVGCDNLLSADSNAPLRAVGLRTNDPRIIADLIHRFESSMNLRKERATASLN